MLHGMLRVPLIIAPEVLHVIHIVIHHLVVRSCSSSRLVLFMLRHELVNHHLRILIRELIAAFLLNQSLELYPVARLVAAEAIEKPFSLCHTKGELVRFLLVVRLGTHGTVPRLDGWASIFRLSTHGLERLENLHSWDLPLGLVVIIARLLLAVESTSCLHGTTFVWAVAGGCACWGVLVSLKSWFLFEPTELLIEVCQLLPLLSIISAKIAGGSWIEKGAIQYWAIESPWLCLNTQEEAWRR